nr:MAG TPA: Protein of unknown function (DUF2680) [Caudoviricetes sp.]
MANPMMQMLLGGGAKRPSNPLAMLAEFRKFAASMTPQRAQQQIQQMLANGTMTQEQFQQLQQQAKDFMAILGK